MSRLRLMTAPFHSLRRYINIASTEYIDGEPLRRRFLLLLGMPAAARASPAAPLLPAVIGIVLDAFFFCLILLPDLRLFQRRFLLVTHGLKILLHGRLLIHIVLHLRRFRGARHDCLQTHRCYIHASHHPFQAQSRGHDPQERRPYQ